MPIITIGITGAGLADLSASGARCIYPASSKREEDQAKCEHFETGLSLAARGQRSVVSSGREEIPTRVRHRVRPRESLGVKLSAVRAPPTSASRSVRTLDTRRKSVVGRLGRRSTRTRPVLPAERFSSRRKKSRGHDRARMDSGGRAHDGREMGSNGAN